MARADAVEDKEKCAERPTTVAPLTSHERQKNAGRARQALSTNALEMRLRQTLTRLLRKSTTCQSMWLKPPCCAEPLLSAQGTQCLAKEWVRRGPVGDVPHPKQDRDQSIIRPHKDTKLEETARQRVRWDHVVLKSPWLRCSSRNPAEHCPLCSGTFSHCAKFCVVVISRLGFRVAFGRMT